ncbi:hypothetical protein GQ600_6126 [Phytophthora cactorum]|nr:hypothetical protein GQ600_6126 [Phytophthora cactorum]
MDPNPHKMREPFGVHATSTLVIEIRHADLDDEATLIQSHFSVTRHDEGLAAGHPLRVAVNLNTAITVWDETISRIHDGVENRLMDRARQSLGNEKYTPGCTTLGDARLAQVEDLYQHCDPESRELVEALKVVVIQRQWDVAKLLCEKLQKKEYEDALQLVDKDDGRMLLDRLYRRCRCYDAEKAIVEATKRLNWTVIKLLADACYSKSANVDKAFKLAIEMDQWVGVNCLYHECSRDTVLEATELAISRGKHEILHLLENNYSIINMTLPFNQLSLGGDNVRVTSEAKPEHQTIRCFIPDLYPFEIDLSSVNTVSDLKSQLHAERPDCFGGVSAESIWLYLAKRGDEWLSEKSEALAMGDSWPVRDLLVRQLTSTRHVKDVFKGVPHGNTIHVIAVKPILRCIIPGTRPFGINGDGIMQIEELKKGDQGGDGPRLYEGGY